MSAFSKDELQILVDDHFRELSSLILRDQPLEVVAHELLEALHRRRRVGPELFSIFRTKRPHRVDEITALERGVVGPAPIDDTETRYLSANELEKIASLLAEQFGKTRDRDRLLGHLGLPFGTFAEVLRELPAPKVAEVLAAAKLEYGEDEPAWAARIADTRGRILRPELAFRDIAADWVGDALTTAHAALDRFELDAAIVAYERLLERLGGAFPDSEAQARLGLGRALLRDGRPGHARAELARVSPSRLPEAQRVTLARTWAVLGEPSQADAALVGDPPGARSVRQLLQLLRGDVPEDLGGEPWLRNQALRVLAGWGNLDRAARLLAEMWPVEGVAARVEAAVSLGIILQRLQVDEPPPPMSQENRHFVLDRVRDLHRSVIRSREPLPPTLLPLWQHAFQLYLVFPVDIELMAEARARRDWDPPLWPWASPDDADPAVPGIDAVKTTEPWSPPPWNEVMQASFLLGMAGDHSGAAARLLDAVERWPDRPRLEALLANELLMSGRATEALPYAERAASRVPGVAQRGLHAQVLLAAERPKEAWELIRAVDAEFSVQLAGLKANIAEAAAPEQAVRLWRTVVRLEPSPQHKLALARVLRRSGDRHEADTIARQLVLEHAEELTVQQLGAASDHIGVSGELTSAERDALRVVVEVLQRRFHGDPEAELLRLQVSAHLREAPSENIDYERIIHAGLAMRLQPDQAAKLHTTQRWVRDGAWALWQRGQLISSALSRTGVFETGLVLALAASFPAPIRPPDRGAPALPAPGPGDPPILLLRPFELLMLARLELLSPLGQRVRDRQIRIGLLGERVLESLERERSSLARNNASNERPFVESVHRHLVANAVLHRFGPPDHELARQNGWVLLTNTPTPGAPTVSAGAITALFDRDGVELSTAIRRGATVAPDVLPADLVILPDVILEPASDDIWWSALVRRTRVHAGPELLAWLEDWLRKLRAQKSAEALTDQVISFLQSCTGWFEIPLPTVPLDLLPAGRDPAGDFARTELELAFGPLLALDSHPDALLLGGEYLLSDLLTATGPKEALARLQWKPARFRAARDRVTAWSKRVVHVPELVRWLGGAVKIREDLARLGFVDALDGRDLLAIAVRFRAGRGLDGDAARAMLTGMETAAADSQHAGIRVARAQLASTYAEAIRLGWMEPTAGLDPEALTRVLLSRVASLDRGEHRSTSALDLTLTMLCAKMAGHSTDAFKVIHEGRATLDDTSGPARLWYAVGAWARGDLDRELSLARSVVGTFTRASGARANLLPVIRALEWPAAPDRWFADPAELGLAALTLGTSLDVLASHQVSFDWERDDGQRGRFSFTRSTALVAAAAQLGRGEPLDEVAPGDLAVHIDTGGPALDVPIPLELLLLALPSDARARYGLALASELRPHDGRLFEAAQALIASPGEPAKEEAFRAAAALSPWRVVRASPRSLAAWGPEGALPGVTPGTLKDLRALLSEPGPLPVGWQALHARAQKLLESDDRGALQHFSLTVLPGALPAIDLRARLAGPHLPAEAARAMETLRAPLDAPMGHVSQALWIVLFAAATAPLVPTATGGEDLRQVLPEVLERLLDAEIHVHDGLLRGDAVPLADHSPSTESGSPAASRKLTLPTGATAEPLARIERDVLCTAADVVGRLAGPQDVHAVDGLWLTWRLYGWLIVQRLGVPEQRRAAWLGDLAGQAPRGVVVDSEDLLDPRGWTEGTPRLASILGAWADVREVLSEELGVPSQDVPAPWSMALEAKLVSLAARPRTAWETRALERRSALGWRGPIDVPSLALRVLLNANPSAFYALPADARARRLQEIPADASVGTEPLDATLRLAAVMVDTGRLTGLEREILRDRLQSEPSPPRAALRAAALSAIAAFEPDLCELALARTIAALPHAGPLAPDIAGQLLAAVPLDRLSATVDALREGGDAAAVALGLARLVVGGTAAVRREASRILIALAAEPGIGDDPRVRHALVTLGLARSPR